VDQIRGAGPLHARRHHKTKDKVLMNQQTNLQHPLGRVPRDFIEDDVIQTHIVRRISLFQMRN